MRLFYAKHEPANFEQAQRRRSNVLFKQHNLTYQLQYTLDLTTTNWINLGSPITATSNSVSTMDILGSDQQRFYRVQLLP